MEAIVCTKEITKIKNIEEKKRKYISLNIKMRFNLLQIMEI